MRILGLILATFCLSNVSNAFSPLQAMVSLEAAASTISKSLNREMFSETVFLNAVSTSHYIGSDIISTGLLGFAFINKIANNDALDRDGLDSKRGWSKITLYNQTQKNINNIVLILMIIFTKNIENAI